MTSNRRGQSTITSNNNQSLMLNRDRNSIVHISETPKSKPFVDENKGRIKFYRNYNSERVREIQSDPNNKTIQESNKTLHSTGGNISYNRSSAGFNGLSSKFPVTELDDVLTSRQISIIENIGDVTPLSNNYQNDDVSPMNLRERPKIRYASNDTSSVDYEINSVGNFTDGPFDIRSGTSTDNRDGIITSVSTPCEMKDGVYYCRNDHNINAKDNYLSEFHNDSLNNHHGSAVIDVCSYSNATIFLLEDGNIICDVKDQDGNVLQIGSKCNDITSKRYRTSNNIKLRRITSFNGYLYGVCYDDKLYTLPNNLFPTLVWIWNYCDWAPSNIKHISSTHNSDHIWIQTNTTGFLYSNPNLSPITVSYPYGKRVYGRDIDHYIDIDPNNCTAKITPSGIIVNNVYDAALSYYDEVVAIHPSDRSEYRAITIVNWAPYYIRA